jgi:4-hydroxybenzoate polyprenyltransferase
VSSLRQRVATYASLVALAHTIFAAPFAVAAILLATRRPHAPITIARIGAIAICLVAARTAAMAYNRFADRDIDAKNPRTKSRHIPAGLVSPSGALGLTLLSSAAFVGSAWTLGPAPRLLAVPVLLVLLGYSHAKRFTWAAHLWLGLALALAPGGAWLALGAAIEPGIVTLMVAVLTWVGGFDVLYSLQDEAFDRDLGLRSIPARFGGHGALRIARGLHVVTISALLATWRFLHGGPFFLAAAALVAGLLVYEHSLVRPTKDGVDLSRLDKAFFDVNGYVSLGFLALVAIDVAWLH